MINLSKISINGKELEAISAKTEHSVILLIKAEKGILGCGYFNVEAANKLGDALAIVTGVKTFDDMLKAKVVKVSDKAKALGIEEGISGKEALEILSR